MGEMQMQMQMAIIFGREMGERKKESIGSKASKQACSMCTIGSVWSRMAAWSLPFFFFSNFLIRSYHIRECIGILDVQRTGTARNDQKRK